MNTTYWTEITDTPIGPLRLTADDDGLTGLYMAPFDGGGSGIGGMFRDEPTGNRDDEMFVEAGQQLKEYFAGERETFDVKLNPSGSAFQLRVWEALSSIPYGEVRSYGEVAEQIGRPGAARAVGLANGQNPISIVVPCHRVIGADGSLTGYGGGIERKRYLLDLEAGRPQL